MIKKLSLAATTILIIGLASSWYVAGRFVAPAPRSIIQPTIDLQLKDIEIRSESGSILAGWHVQANKTKGVIVLLHGIRSSRMQMIDRAKLLYDQGYSSILIDFQAHGESPGEYITIGHLEKFDVKATIDFARSKHPNEPIAVIGVSLGGASAVLAAPLGIDALILESVYTNISTAVHNRVAMRLGPFSWLPAELLLAQLKPRFGFSVGELSPINMIKYISCPVYIIAGEVDLHTTKEETRRLFNLANSPKKLWLVENFAHVDIYNASPEAYKKNIIMFLSEHLKKES